MTLLDELRQQVAELPDPSLIILKKDEWDEITLHMEQLGSMFRDPQLPGRRSFLGIPVDLNEKWDGRKVLNKVWAQAYRAHATGAL